MKKYLYFFLLMPVLALGQTPKDSITKLFNKKMYIEAERTAMHYLKANPQDMEIKELLGDAYGYQKKWDEAISVYKQLVNYKRNSAEYQYKYGGAMGMKALAVSKIEALGMVSDIRDAFLKAAELDPKHTNVRWALVEFYMQLPGIIGGSKAKALKYADELYNLSKVDGYLAKGYIYEYDKELEKAELYYKKAVVTGGSVTCYTKLTQFYINQKQTKKALKYLHEGYSIHKNEVFLKQIKTLEK